MLKSPTAACLLLMVLVALVVGCDSVAPESPPAEKAASAAKPVPKPKLLPGARTRVLAAAGDREDDKTFDDLRFDIAVGAPFHRDMLTPEIAALDGQPIRIRGFILPTPQKRGIKQF